MNITTAREQLHEISKSNPENSIFHFFQFDASKIGSPQKNNSHYHSLMKSPPQNQQAYNHFLQQQCSKIITKKASNQQKVEVKIPLFKNTRKNNLLSSQKERFSKLGLEGFLNEDIPQQNNSSLLDEHEEQKIIKNLNNTYFKTTEHINAKRKSMINTLGIKKTSMSSYKVDWNANDYQKIQFQWKQIQYIPNKIFPCRKNSNTKNRIYTSKSKDSQKNTSMVKVKNQNINDELVKVQKTLSVNLFKNKKLDGVSSLLTQKSLSPKKSPNDSKREKFYSINSMIFSSPKKSTKKNEFQICLKDQELLRPRSPNRRRPFTSNESNRSQSLQKNERKHSQSLKPNPNIFLEEFSFTHNNKQQQSPIRIAKDYEMNTGVVIGHKITLHK